MSRTTKLGLAAALVVVVVAVLAWASLASLAGTGPQAAATAFFKTLADKGAAAAYASASTAFQQATPADAFAQAAQARGLGDYKSSDWGVRSSQGPLAEVSGAVTSKTGALTPVDVRLVKGAAGWQVLALDFPQSGLAANGGGAQPAAAGMGQGGDYADGDQPALGAPAPGPSPGLAPPAPAGATPPYGPPPATPGMAGPVAPQGAPAAEAQGYGPPSGYGGGQTGPASVSSSRVARMCGRELMRHDWAQSVQLHCPSPIAASVGATTRCMALVNGRRTGLTATMSRYDARRDDAELSCRLD